MSTAPPPPPTLELIEEARAWLAPRVRRTPVEPSPRLAERLGAPVHLKLEALQLTGSFKLRGALFRLSRLGEAERGAGVATVSAGNHGKALAWAARDLGIRATVYVPASVDEAKARGIEELGARVARSPHPGYDDTAEWAREAIARSGAVFVSAFDEPEIMAGNGGSLAHEVLEQAPEARTFVLPAGGGGLAAGFALVVKEAHPDCRLVCVQHRDSPALALSLSRGEAVTRLPAIETAAGGVEGGMGAACFAVLESRVDQVALVAEEEILDAVRWMLDHHQLLVEPSAAVPIAACLAGRVTRLAGPVVVVLTGRNVSLATLRRILAA